MKIKFKYREIFPVKRHRRKFLFLFWFNDDNLLAFRYIVVYSRTIKPKERLQKEAQDESNSEKLINIEMGYLWRQFTRIQLFNSKGRHFRLSSTIHPIYWFPSCFLQHNKNNTKTLHRRRKVTCKNVNKKLLECRRETIKFLNGRRNVISDNTLCPGAKNVNLLFIEWIEWRLRHWKCLN